MTKYQFLLASMLLILLVLSSCSPRASTGAGGTTVDSKLGSTNGITLFGDARLGVAF